MVWKGIAYTVPPWLSDTVNARSRGAPSLSDSPRETSWLEVGAFDDTGVSYTLLVAIVFTDFGDASIWSG